MIHGELKIIFQDDNLVVVEKPGGLLSVPGRGPDKQDCVVSRLKSMLSFSLDQPAVHRLDMATSGLMVLARTRDAHRHLSDQFASHTVRKTYIALVQGHPQAREGLIELAFRLDPDNRPYQVYDPLHGKPGISRWRLLGREKDLSRIEFQPRTGRTHQLRLHAAHPLGLNCPIKGDPLYGTSREGERLLLHATALSFSHPISGQRLSFSSSAPF